MTIFNVFTALILNRRLYIITLFTQNKRKYVVQKHIIEKTHKFH